MYRYSNGQIGLAKRKCGRALVTAKLNMLFALANLILADRLCLTVR